MKGREFFQAASSEHIGVIRFIIRYIPYIDTGMKIEFNGNRYKLISITNDDAMNRTITIIGETVE